MAETTARKLADGFLAFCGEHGDSLCNLKLQKVLYYAQGWHLAIYDKLLFGDSIQAWIHGPVVPQVYRDFKEHSWKPISVPEDIKLDLSPSVREHLQETWSVYGSISAWDLERMTHQEPPWLNARAGLPADAPSGEVISPNDMKQYFKSLR